MENVYENVRRELSHEHVKEALQVMLERIHLPENEAKIVAAKEQAGDDMVEVMRTVFPIVIEIQTEVVHKFGFTPNQDGLKEFLIRVNQFTTEHNEILDLLLQIREVYLPSFDLKGGAGGGGGTSTPSSSEQQTNTNSVKTATVGSGGSN